MKIRAHYLLAGALLALAPTAPVSALAEEGAIPSCACPLSLVQSSATVGAIAEATGNVLVSHTASFVAAESGAPLSVGSRVITGAKSSAKLTIGGSCSVSIDANASATVVQEGQQLCVRVLGQEKTASVTTLEPRGAEYGQSADGVRPRFGFPEMFFGGATIATIIGFVADDKDDDEGASD